MNFATSCRDPKPPHGHPTATLWVNGAYLRFSKSTGFSMVAEDRCEGALLAFQPLSRYAPIPEPEPNSLPTASRPTSSPLQAYYWPTSSQRVRHSHRRRHAPGWAGAPEVPEKLQTRRELLGRTKLPQANHGQAAVAEWVTP